MVISVSIFNIGTLKKMQLLIYYYILTIPDLKLII